jgi:hypothetical protein
MPVFELKVQEQFKFIGKASRKQLSTSTGFPLAEGGRQSLLRTAAG